MVDGRERVLPGARRATRSSGLDVDTAGCVTLDGQQALAYVRSRHYQRYEDGRWRTDPSGDLGRISRQQDFIIRALHRAVAQGGRNPLTLDRLVDAGLATVTVDDLLTADDIIRLGQAFRSFDPGSLVTYSLPDPRRLGRGRVDPPPGGRGGAADPRPLPRHRPRRPAPSDVRVLVLNGSGRHRPRRRDQRRAHRRRVRCRRHRGGRAVRRHRARGPLHGRERGQGGPGGALPGSERASSSWWTGSSARTSSWSRARCSPACAPRPTPGPLDHRHDHAPPSPGTTSTTSSSTTSTTVVGYVPQAPDGVDC